MKKTDQLHGKIVKKRQFNKQHKVHDGHYSNIETSFLPIFLSCEPKGRSPNHKHLEISLIPRTHKRTLNLDIKLTESNALMNKTNSVIKKETAKHKNNNKKKD